MKKKFLAATLIAMTLAMAGCTSGGDATGTGSGESSVTESSAAQSSDASVETSKESEESKATEESKEPDGMASAGSKEDMGIDDSWKMIYANFLEKEFKPMLDDREPEWDLSWTFGFIYINDDPIPELVINSGYEAAGNVICTIINGKVEQFQTARLSFYYKEFGNIVDNAEGHMGYYYDEIFTITEDGFAVVHEGEYQDEYGDNGPTGKTTYYMDGNECTKDEYYKVVDAAIPAKDRTYFSNGSYYDNVIDYLKGKGPKSYKEAYSGLIRKGLSTGNEKMRGFALIERDGYDPLLLCVGEKQFMLCAYEDGLVQVGPGWWFSEEELVLVYPNLGIVQSHRYYENNVMSMFNYYMRGGSLIYDYQNTECLEDENWEPILDKDGNLITIYKINDAEVEKDTFSKYQARFDEKAKLQLAPYNAEYTFIIYFDTAEMLNQLAK